MKSVAVVGAGPGGLYAAREAASLGLAVDVFDKDAVGENISCAEGFFDLLKLLAPPPASVCYQVSEIVVTVIDTFTIDCSHLNFWIINRSEWQKSLANEITRLGCNIFEQTNITPEQFFRIRQEYKWVIDASGTFPVSGQREYSADSFAHTAQYTLAGDFSALGGKIKVVAEPEYCGYYWIFPKSIDSANVGVGWFGSRRKNLQIHRELKRILKQEELSEFAILKKCGGPIPVKRKKELLLGNTLLVGNAAGLASPLHGGGIDTACISGILAGRAIAEGRPREYPRRVEKILGKRLVLEKKILELYEELGHSQLNEHLAFLFHSGYKASRTLGNQFALKKEAKIIRFLLDGKLSADFKTGLNLNQLPLFARLMLRKAMMD
ncbi:MAG: NAD(P)/FAD-dependent oxidoreductase [Clostridiales bacterium]|jgi:digeranylgeranylglycerophospholipid reductase|nr:NAD(P)/FAD-dependent oxidoreductase [Clostridiales bacterium]